MSVVLIIVRFRFGIQNNPVAYQNWILKVYKNNSSIALGTLARMFFTHCTWQLVQSMDTIYKSN